MNILPKKRWHVRTKENIARVRKDEAEAAEKERQESLRIEAANREARLNVLKQKRKQELSKKEIHIVYNENEKNSEHVNLFSDLEHAVKTTNKEHDKEIKNKKEEYEKKIGYLTYLGQDTNEALGKKNWYELPPETSRFSRSEKVKDTYEKLVLKDEDGNPKKVKSDEKDGEIGWKSKQRLDPIYIFRKKSESKLESNKQISLINEKYNKKSKANNHKDDPKTKLQKLREARLKREQQEKYRTEIFLKKLNGSEVTTEKDKGKEKQIIPKYNSQFNPELARQNFR